MTGFWQFSGGGVSSTQLWVVSSTLTNVSSTNIFASGYIQSPTVKATTSLFSPLNQTITTSGQISVKTTSSTLNFHDGTAERVLNPEQCFAPAFTIQYVSSTESDVQIWNPKATSTITSLTGLNTRITSGTMDFNIIWDSSGNKSSSTSNHLFASNTTSTATTTVDKFPSLVAFSSTTVNAYDSVRLITGSRASTTQWSLTICWRENP